MLIDMELWCLAVKPQILGMYILTCSHLNLKAALPFKTVWRQAWLQKSIFTIGAT